jgi:hypothetical protein
MSPLRVCDTRAGQAANTCNQGTGIGHRLGANSVVKVNVSGIPPGVSGSPSSIPNDGTAQAAVLNLTAIAGTLPTYLSIFPPFADGSCPTSSTTSNINVSGGVTEANRVFVSLGPDVSGGLATDVCVSTTPSVLSTSSSTRTVGSDPAWPRHHSARNPGHRADPSL